MSAGSPRATRWSWSACGGECVEGRGGERLGLCDSNFAWIIATRELDAINRPPPPSPTPRSTATTATEKEKELLLTAAELERRAVELHGQARRLETGVRDVGEQGKKTEAALKKTEAHTQQLEQRALTSIYRANKKSEEVRGGRGRV